MSEDRNNTYVVQFGTLEEMITEMAANFRAIDGIPWPPVVRIVAGRTMRYSGQPSGQCVAVHVRAIDHNRDTILACMIVAGAYEELYGRPFGSDAQEKADAAWERARKLEAAIEAHIAEVLPDVQITGGVLHLGINNSHLLPATWQASKL